MKQGTAPHGEAVRHIYRGRATGRVLLGRIATASVLAWAVAGCSLDNVLKNNEVPPSVTDPALTQTHDGALEVYRGTNVWFQRAFGGPTYSFVINTGLLSDELGHWTYSFSGGAVDFDFLDARIMLHDEAGSFAQLQRVRGQAGQAIGLLVAYAPDERALRGHAYALDAYAEIMLAELYCSGIPLSTLDYNSDFTYQPGSTTSKVFEHAVALLDTASTLVEDSLAFVRLAAIGKGRALLGLGDYAGAAAAVAAVPDDYRYDVSYSGVTTANATNAFVNKQNDVVWAYTVANREGSNGLDYITSGDPRSAVVLQAMIDGFPIYAPTKYVFDGSSPIVLASGVEARLIEAEAALRINPEDGQWLATLNHLRQIAPTINPAWPVLADTMDPGTATGRVNLLFRERALWLFLTGHRQGDMRRLIRQYGQDQATVYPIGTYPKSRTETQYGHDVTVPIPDNELVANPLFTGCIDRKA